MCHSQVTNERGHSFKSQDYCIIIIFCDIVVACGGQVLTPLLYFLKLFFIQSVLFFMSGVEEHAKHLMPKIVRLDLKQIHWR